MFYRPMNKMAKWLLKPGEDPDVAAKKRRVKRYKTLKSFCTALKIMVHLGVLGYCIYYTKHVNGNASKMELGKKGSHRAASDAKARNSVT